MSAFDVDWSKVDPHGNASRFQEGRTLATVLEVKVQPSKDPSKPGAVNFIAECEDEEGAPRSVVYEIKIDPYGYGKADAKAFVAAALGLEFGAVTNASMSNVMGGAQTLVGKKVVAVGVRTEKMTGRGKDRRGTGEFFTKITFRPAGSSTSVAPGRASAPPPVTEPSPFPPEGWKAHPQAAGWYYEVANPKNMKQEKDLRNL